uniref:CX domain-containing protein n=1 Tax=Caenorhabditis tropicalis TaxID=1561998 RepID=A0A1I7T727_9PELO
MKTLIASYSFTRDNNRITSSEPSRRPVWKNQMSEIEIVALEPQSNTEWLLENLNPFTFGSVGFYIFCFFLGILASRWAHHVVRTTRFSKIRRYAAQKKLKQFNQINHAKFTFLCGQADEQYCKSEDLNFCHKFLNHNFPGHGVEIPSNLCSLWVPRDGFTCGTEFQDFKPHEGRAFESFLTYQMITDRAQVTWYNLRDGRRYVAGICIYLRLQNESDWISPPIQLRPIQKAMEMWYDYTPQKEREKTTPPDYTALLMDEEEDTN